MMADPPADALVDIGLEELSAPPAVIGSAECLGDVVDETRENRAFGLARVLGVSRAPAPMGGQESRVEEIDERRLRGHLGELR